jgi:hypothetical protein
MTVVPIVKSVVASIVPPARAPVVVIPPDPTSMEVKPEVMEPAFKAPTDVICVCEASTLKLCAMLSPLVAPLEVSPVPPVIVAT